MTTARSRLVVLLAVGLLGSCSPGRVGEAADSCSDGRRNGIETDVDCADEDCLGRSCGASSACADQLCAASKQCAVVLKGSGTPCRPSQGPCDLAESCTGTSASCPADQFLGTDTVCRAGSGCDREERCSGSSASCPADGPPTEACLDADGCCPAGCGFLTDGDCPIAPASGALLGAYVGSSAGTVAQVEVMLGRPLAITHQFFDWDDNWVSYADASLASGHLPLVTWEPWLNGTGIDLAAIAAGTHDTLIRTRAKDAAALGSRFLLRWGHEMNGNWYPWDGSHNGSDATATALYISAWRHLHDVFVQEGATNVQWVFCLNVDTIPNVAWNAWSNYYPGDGYVDWMSFDGYSGGVSPWRSFSSMLGTVYAGMAAKGKPILIAETAASESDGDKPAWISGIVPALSGSYPQIKALLWFDTNKEADWRLDSSAGSEAASISMANQVYLKP